MAEYNAPATLVTPGGTIAFNPTSPPGYINDASLCSGLDMVPLRVMVDDKPSTDGGIVHTGYLGPRRVILGGQLWALTITDRQALEDNLVAALESIMAADGTYQWVVTTESTSYTRSVTVRCEIALNTSGGFQKGYTFGLVAADPTITENGTPFIGSAGQNTGGGGTGPTALVADFTIG